MLTLIRNEFIKLFGRKSNWIMLILMAGLIGGMAFIVTKTNDSLQSFQADDVIESKGGLTVYKMKDGQLMLEEEFWNQDLTSLDDDSFEQVPLTLNETIDLLKSSIKKYESNPKKYEQYLVKSAKNQLTFYEAYDEKELTPFDVSKGTSSASFFSVFGHLTFLPTLFSVVIASMIIASEFTGGTIKLLLIRPFTRTQILLSKYITTLIYGLMVSTIMVFASFLASFALPYQSLTVPLSAEYGLRSALDIATHLFATNFLLLALYVTIAFFFSAVIRSQVLAVGVGMGILFSGNILGQFLPNLIEKYGWLKWNIFNLLSLNDQVLGIGYIPKTGLSIQETIIDIILHITIILSATIFIFNKRDVALT